MIDVVKGIEPPIGYGPILALSEMEAEGQAVYRGPVILSWEDVLPEGRDPDEGYNVVIHEFAHQLDFLDNAINGTPPLGDRELEALALNGAFIHGFLHSTLNT
jgi:Mlc titration factor MtfA (ptsG expression regulator)